MKIKYISVICIIFILVGCSKIDDNIKIFDKFPREYSLSNIEVSTPPVLNMVGEIELLDSVLITMDIKGDKFFHAFKLPKLDYLGSYIQKGHGPNEETFINPYFQHIDGNKFMYQNSIAIKIAKFELNSNEISIVKNFNMPGELMNLQSPFIINDQILGSNPFEKSNIEFLSYDPISKKTTTFGAENLEFNDKIPSSKNKFIFAKIVSNKPDKSLFAVVYDKFPILRLYKSNGILIKEIRYKNGQISPKELTNKSASKSKLYQIMQNYRKLKTTNRYIYALYIGKTTGELSTQGSQLDDFSNEIHVWDWDGNPIAKILLDKKYFSFCVTPDDKYLICSSLGSIDKFYKYSLKWEN